MRGAVSLLTGFLLIFAASMAAAQQSSIVGQWQFSNGQYQATVTFGQDGSYLFVMRGPQGQQQAAGRYTVQGNQIQVQFQNGMQQSMSYSMADANTLAIMMNGQQMMFTRSGGQAGQIPGGQQPGQFPNQPRTQPGESPHQLPGQQPGMGPGQGTQGMQAIQHPAGFTFQAPAGWQVQPSNQLVVMVPNDAHMTDQGPAEAVIVWTEPTQGVSNPLDPQVSQYFSQQVSQNFPFLQAMGSGQPYGQGAVYSYQGTNPLNITISGRLYLRFSNNVAYATFGLCPQERMGQRDSQYQQIHATLPGGAGPQQMPGNTPGQMPNQFSNQPGQPPAHGTPGNTGPGVTTPGQGGQLDQQLVGLWTYVEQSQNGGGMAIVRGLDLRADGSYMMGSKAAGQAAAPAGGSDWQIEDQGSWQVNNGMLVLSSQSGNQLQLKYQFGGNGVIFTDQQGNQYNCKRDQL